MEEFKKNDDEADFEDDDGQLGPKNQEHHEHQSHHHSEPGVQENKPTVHHEPSVHHEQHQRPKSKPEYDFWKIVSAVLAVVLVVVLLYTSLFSNGGISKEDAADQTLNFVNTKLLQGQTTATLVGVEEKGELYNVKFSVNGQLVDGYVTKDGELFFPQAIDMSGNAALPAAEPSAPAAQELPKADKPKVELFVMSHCPYGTQAEKAMIPVVQELGDKIDFSVKFVNYAMHGEKEVLEEMNQVCIENEQNAKYLDYLSCFLKEGDGETCLTETKIDQAELSSCVQKLDTEFKIKKNLEDQSTWSGGRFPLFLVHNQENEEYGVQGSPTLVINGQQASASRSPAGFLAAVCGAFSEVPEECGAELSAAQASAGFGYDTTGAATAANCII